MKRSLGNFFTAQHVFLANPKELDSLISSPPCKGLIGSSWSERPKYHETREERGIVSCSGK